MCKRAGCDGEQAWSRGRLAGLCETHGAEETAVWHADPRVIAGARRGGRGKRVEHPCAWRGCGIESTVRLHYGAPNLYSGQPVPGVNYCADHAEQVRTMFVVGEERAPSHGGRARRWAA